MAVPFFWMVSVLLAVLALNNHHCVMAPDKNPQKMVGIIELMLSKRPNESEQNVFGIQKVPQEGSPNYEIHITPNKNVEELKGSQKIKIFVEAANFDSDDKHSKGVEKRENQNIFDVLPLSIETVGLNIQRYQGSDFVGKPNEPPSDYESYPSKRQTNWGSNQKGRSKSEPKTSHQIGIQPGYVDQNNPYQPVIVPKKETPTYDGEYSSVQTGKRVPQQTFVEVYPEEVAQRPKEPKRTYETTYEESRPSRTSDERRTGYGREGEEDYRPSSSRNPSYEEERRPSYGQEGGRPSNDRKTYAREPEKTRYPEYEEEGNPVYGEPEVKPSYQKDSTKDYDVRPQDSRERPVRQNSGYSGFPESQTDLSSFNSRPLQYEPARAFPASPCLNVFKYEGREPEEDRWYADIYVTTEEVLNGMRLDIRLDRPAEIMTNWLAEVKTKDSIHFTLLSLTHRLVPGPPETVRIMVKFNHKKPVPYLKSISLNGRQICPHRAQKTTTKRPVYENAADLQVKPTRPTTQYQEGPKRPNNYKEESGSTTKRATGYTESRRPTTPYEEPNRKTTPRPSPEYLRPNPNGYEETDQNSFNGPTKKPPGRPAHSNGKPPPHAAKPAQGVKPGNGQGPNKHQANNNKPPVGNKPPTQIEVQGSGSQKQILCGTSSVQPRPLITHGQLTSRGQWPWHVALYKNIGTDLTFFCGGSLINNKYVLTAAHCVTESYSTRPLDYNTLVVYLGKYHLHLWSEGGVQNRQVSQIYVHPNYNSTSFQSDIAVLALSSPVEYTDYIRPICLWDRSNTRIEDVEGREGTVVGWGFDENKQLTQELRQAKMPVVAQKTCLWSYPEFFPQFTSNLTYCAGFKNGTSVCNGDSGGGMVFPTRDSKGVERWKLRGLVSISPGKHDFKVCDPTHYVIFTDVAKFLPWLDNFV